MREQPGKKAYAWTQSAEARLLLAGCRKFLGAETSISDFPVDEDAFLTLAREHRLELVLAKAIVHPRRSSFSAATLRKFAAAEKRALVSHLKLVSAAIETHRALKNAEIPHLYLKGPVLAETIFPGKLLRYSCDLDILVEPSTLRRADRCLRDLGFRPDTVSDDLSRRSRFSLAAGKDVCYRRPGFNHGLELHWKTHPVDPIANSPGYSFSESLTWESFHGEALPVFEDRLNCIYLCFHAAKHNWSRLRWLMDIALFLRVKNLEWPSLIDRARHFGLETPVWEAAILMRDLLALSLPSELAIPAAVERRFYRRYELQNHGSRSKLGSFEMFLKQGFLYSDPRLTRRAFAFHTWTLVSKRTRASFRDLTKGLRK